MRLYYRNTSIIWNLSIIFSYYYYDRSTNRISRHKLTKMIVLLDCVKTKIGSDGLEFSIQNIISIVGGSRSSPPILDSQLSLLGATLLVQIHAYSSDSQTVKSRGTGTHYPEGAQNPMPILAMNCRQRHFCLTNDDNQHQLALAH
jgi:hypothetical protein